MGRLICELHRPGMTALHRVGLAGLYMTLDAFNRDADAKAALEAAGLGWTLEERRITLDFAEGHADKALTKLMALAFQLDDGFIRLPGLERGAPPTLEQKWLLYQALLGTFLQFGPHRPTCKKDTLVIEIDDQQMRIPGFAPILHYKHQSAMAPKKTKQGKTESGDFVEKDGSLKDSVEVKGWLYPGGMKRHEVHNDSMLEEPAELAFCLLFAPVGAIFFQVASRRSGRKARTALVLPTVTSLRGYSTLRRSIAAKGVLALTAASPTDAVLQLAAMVQGQELAEHLNGPIRVMAFGIVTWNEKQKSRTAAYAITPFQLPGMTNYERANAIFKNRWQVIKAKMDRKGNIKEPQHAFVRPFTAREIIADNIANRRPWYANFADYMTGQETRVALQFERKELFEMTQTAEYDHPNERIFIQTCHEAWRRRLGQLGERSRREHISFTRLAGGEYEKLRVALARCKTATTLRATLTDFWSRAGSLPALQEGWCAILPLLEEEQWRKARDLALLALASYQPSNADEQKALTESTTQTDAEGT
jgi:CRISPR-associated protein Cas8a1/Csx13